MSMVNKKCRKNKHIGLEIEGLGFV